MAWTRAWPIPNPWIRTTYNESLSGPIGSTLVWARISGPEMVSRLWINQMGIESRRNPGKDAVVRCNPFGA
ncbi:hypothetical protein AG1IA_09290 [Rhizoctonia solani AG-1 IA]|uniref:Uncharacterized protein n=1 Tax=Thanatephorus cucumeris (strain AG1-IA) TaxID=983506 RepID=L8WJZ0_THACA|nr:hypothetical protein AG1IA_09290 [Rhizoctonia solani AG-1 IA]